MGRGTYLEQWGPWLGKQEGLSRGVRDQWEASLCRCLCLTPLQLSGGYVTMATRTAESVYEDVGVMEIRVQLNGTCGMVWILG